MKRILALLALMAVLTQSASAGSAVAWGPRGHLVYSFGHPVEISKQRALEMARHKNWLNVAIIAATDINGYGAIAVALHPNGHGSVIGVALGRRSAAEADKLALEQCVQNGGTNPKIKSTFRG
jgi:hypothetical protein